jgi:heme O synthase-like polyprenyltransferase
MNSLLGALKSKTVWAGVATAVAGQLFPVVDGWVATNPSKASAAVGLLMIVLRTVTTTSLSDK